MESSIKKLRPAIAMLELIFALVIMGIIMASAPLLISTATQSGFTSMQQEAINEAASQVNIVLGHQWDENNTNDLYLATILNVTNGDSDLDDIVPTGRRLGTPEESHRSFIRADGRSDLSASSTASFGHGSGEDGAEAIEDDMDDFSGTTYLVDIEPSTADYIETTTINIATAVTYNDDTADYNQATITFDPFTPLAGGGTSNIKQITVTLTSSSSAEELNKKKIILRAFSCNIGEYQLAEKDF